MNYEYNPNDYDFNDYVAQSNNKINSMQKYNQNNYENGGNNYKNNNKDNMAPKGNYTTMSMEEALSKSSYPNYTKDFVKDFIINNYYNHERAKVFLTSVDNENLFVIEYNLPVQLNNKTFKINVLVYLPALYPNYSPEFYIHKKGNIGIHNSYKQEKINSNNLKINIDSFVPFDPEKNNVEEIIHSLLKDFNDKFPIYRKDRNEPDEIQSGKCILNKNITKEIIINKKSNNQNNNKIYVNEFNSNSNNNCNNNYNSNINRNNKNNNNDNNNKNCFNDDSILEFMRTQTKDIMREKYMNFTSQYNNINKNQNDLRDINNSLIINSSNKEEETKNFLLKEENEKLQKLKEKLEKIEKKMIEDNEQLKQNNEKKIFDKCDDYIRINNEKYLEKTIKIKAINDYMFYLKKGFEKKMISLEEMINKTRILSRELFTIYYARNKIRNENDL